MILSAIALAAGSQTVFVAINCSCCIVRRQPYHVECTGSLLTSEVKRRRARLVLGWGAAWEDLRVLSAFLPAPTQHDVRGSP